MDKIQKIKTEIERLIQHPRLDEEYNAAYQCGLRDLRAFIESLEKEPEPKIKGWVARCKWPCPDELYFYRGEEKPIRCGSHVEDVKEDFYWDFQYEVAPLDPSLFPDLKWEDEPIEVELIIKRV